MHAIHAGLYQMVRVVLRVCMPLAQVAYFSFTLLPPFVRYRVVQVSHPSHP
ncbi:hypothetical protein ALP02_200204 [Pseudomonas coronafaciens pv. garcae]|nr:hypothetical protein ALP02_200204 [Pseudomonas coronafaciens pv. garcae]